MKKSTLTVALFGLLMFSLVIPVGASSMWSQTYGGTENDGALSLVQTSDGGYALAGMTESFGHGSDRDDFWLVKTDSSGNMEWNQTYGGTKNEYGFCLAQTSDGGYAMAGSTYSFGAGNHDSWLVKTDAFGNMEWNQTYGGTDADGATSLIQTADGGYVLAGSTRSFGAGEDDFWLIKTDEVGKMQWNRTYGGTGSDIAISLIETSDGGYALVGYTESFGAGSDDFWFVKTDEIGNMQWNQTYGGTKGDYAFSLVETSDGGYAIAGYTFLVGAGNSDLWLIKTDEQGVIPEFPSWIILPLFTITALFVMVIKKKMLASII
jgi:hypothetical protein